MKPDCLRAPFLKGSSLP